ncbi:MAG: DNA-directed RNA polymerase subunit alpha [bacterium]
MKWKNLQIPKSVVLMDNKKNDRYGKFILEPLERGFGITIGNSLRRVLLSSIQGAAVVSVRIDGALHEYCTLPGIKEDISEIILNIKKLRFKLKSNEESAILRLDVQGKGEVKAKNIEENPNIEILNPEHHIATINEKANLNIEMKVREDRGYKEAESNKREGDPIGVIAMDAAFSPVSMVNYRVENTRVGQSIDYDRLELEIYTDGSITPEDALAYAAKLLQNHFSVFVNFKGELIDVQESKVDEEKQRINSLLNMRVDELELSVRSSNCLRLANIHTIKDLVKHPESEMLKHKNFGRKSLIELNQILSGMGLSFGMDITEAGIIQEN